MSEMNEFDAGLEAALLGLKPRPATVNRDAVLFAAGRAAGIAEQRRQQRRLVASTAAGWLAAVAVGGAWLGAGGVSPGDRVIVEARPDEFPVAVQPVGREPVRRESEPAVAVPAAVGPETMPAPALLPEWRPEQEGYLTIRGYRPVEGPAAGPSQPADRPAETSTTVLELRRRWSEEFERDL